MQPVRIEGLLTQIQSLQSMMVAVSTGGPRIQDKEAEYSELYLDIATEIESFQQAGFAITNPNPFRSLWDWYGYWSTNLGNYASRRQYVRELYGNVVNPLQSSLHKHRVEATSPEELAQDIEKRLTKSPKPHVAAFQVTLDSLHPKVVQRCRVAFETGQYDDAIFNALKTVEEELRSRASADPTDLGVALVSKALNPKAPKLVFSQVDAEQEAANSLYRGAIGSFKNPLSHRFLDTDDPVRTFEVLSFASLLLRMLDNAANNS